MNFRNDILRGVRLFLIAFSSILVVYGAYQMFRQPPGVEGAGVPEAAQSQPAEPSAEPHPLVVPAPPPAGGVPEAPRKVARTRPSNTPVPDPPPVAPIRSTRVAAPVVAREFETPAVNMMAPPSAEPSPEVKVTPAKKAIGYKSLLEANQNRPIIEPEPAPAVKEEEPAEKPKGGRFARAVGKWFRGGAGKKESTPLTLQQPKP